jgi:hypothetical protein
MSAFKERDIAQIGKALVQSGHWTLLSHKLSEQVYVAVASKHVIDPNAQKFLVCDNGSRWLEISTLDPTLYNIVNDLSVTSSWLNSHGDRPLNAEEFI